MKNLFHVFISLFVLIILSQACKKDDNNSSPKNHLKYEENTYELTSGFLENYGKYGDEAYNIDLTLVSSGFTIYEVNGELDSLSGVGHAVYFELYSSSSDKLDLGTFYYDSEGTGAAGTFDYSYGVINYDVEKDEGTEFNIKGGSLTVSKNGSEYEIAFDNGSSISGYYKGTLKYYDYSDGLKSAKINPQVRLKRTINKQQSIH